MQLRRRLATTTVALVAVCAALLAAPAAADAGFRIERVAGQDRYETAAFAALAGFPAGSDAVVLARGDAFADALAGAYLAGQLDAPVVLTRTAELPEVTAAAIDTLGATQIFLLGGPAAISQEVEDGFGEEFTVTRLAGTTRYGTAAAAVAAAGDDVGTVGDARTAIVASGVAFADAVAVGPVAFSGRFPLLLTPPTALASETAAALEDLAIDRVLVAGGTGAVSDAVLTEIRALGATVQRLAGETRYSTAAAVADFALTNLGFVDHGVDLASGQSFADALAAGPLAGRDQRPLLLTTTASLHADTRTWLTDHAATLRLGRIVGGTAAVAEATKASAAAAATTVAATPAAEGQLTAIDPEVGSYTVVPSGEDTATTVAYREADAFTVDGAATDIAGFEEAATPADRIRFVPATGSGPARHELTEVDPATITSGTVGNVDLSADQLDIVHPVTGDALRADISYAEGTYRIDGNAAVLNELEADLNEGDTIQIVGTSFRLTNQAVTGPAEAIERSGGLGGLSPSTSLRIGALGDDPATSADAKYAATGGDQFTVEGQSSDYATFNAQLTQGDEVTYSRRLGAEQFGLKNLPPAAIEGQAVGDLSAGGAGGSFTIATDDGTERAAYGADGTFTVDGQQADEATFEAAYSAGDDVVFIAGDAVTGTTQRITLRNLPLSGGVDPESVNTADGNALSPGNRYAVLAINGSTRLATVSYSSTSSLFVDGAPATMEEWEAALTAIAEGTAHGFVVFESVTRGDTTVVQHRLTTRPAA